MHFGQSSHILWMEFNSGKKYCNLLGYFELWSLAYCYKYALLNFLCSILMSSLLLSGGQKYLPMLDLGNILLLLSKNEVLFLRIFICHWIFKLRDVCVIHKSRIFGANFVLLQRLDKQEILVLCKWTQSNKMSCKKKKLQFRLKADN